MGKRSGSSQIYKDMGFKKWLGQRMHLSNDWDLWKNFKDRPQGTDVKPYGLWYDCDGEWIRYGPDVRFGTDSSDYSQRYGVKPNFSKILKIGNERQFLAFEKQYGVVTNPSWSKEGPRVSEIKWPEVALQYSGIEICPYQTKYRNDNLHFWYTGWDVASGCIWRKDGLLGIEKQQID